MGESGPTDAKVKTENVDSARVAVVVEAPRKPSGKLRPTAAGAGRHRVAADEALADRLRVTWLNEDETTTSFLDLLLRIYRALAAGLHWCYKPNGSFAWSDNDDDPQEDGCSGTTPPGHPRWVSPLEKQAQCWSNHFTDTEITDPETIARLERDEPPEGDDASINRPVDLDTLDSELRKELESSSQQRKRATAHEN